MKPKFAITPCPNDVFSYCFSIQNKDDFNFVFDDIESLNLAAEKGVYEITKLSFPAWLKNRDKYILLNAGAALGIGTGPVFVAKKDYSNFENEGVAVPGLNTTANLLFKFYSQGKIPVFPMRFSDILPALINNKVSSGVLIHEGRFIYKNHGLELIQDLGEYWSKHTDLPIPLGCICLRKDLAHLQNRVEEKIRESIKWAFNNEDKTIPLVKQYAQHLDDDVLKNHIHAFVNKYSYDIKDIREKLVGELIKIWK